MNDNEKVEQLRKAASQLTSIVLRQEKDILHLNQMLRDTGYGQGQIDAYASICEENEILKERLKKYELQ